MALLPPNVRRDLIPPGLGSVSALVLVVSAGGEWSGQGGVLRCGGEGTVSRRSRGPGGQKVLPDLPRLRILGRVWLAQAAGQGESPGGGSVFLGGAGAAAEGGAAAGGGTAAGGPAVVVCGPDLVTVSEVPCTGALLDSRVVYWTAGWNGGVVRMLAK